MPRTVTKTVYQYDELSEKAQGVARDWFREMLDRSQDMNYAEPVIDEVSDVAAKLGVTLARKGRDNGLAIYWSGFSSQGDGACFEGVYGAPAAPAGPAIREAYPTETKLHAIADTLDKLQGEWANTLAATVKHSGHYYHSGCTDIDVRSADGEGGEADVSLATEKATIEALRAFMDWIYRSLESSFDAERADETVAANILANEYEFEADGTRTRD